MEENRLSIMTHMSAEQLEKMQAFKDLHRETFYNNLMQFGNQKDMYGQSQGGCKKPSVGG